SVSRTRPVPSESIAQTSKLEVSISQTNAIRVLSGDQVGLYPREAMRTTLDPSGFMMYTPAGPSRLLTKASFRPSGDHAGDPSPDGVLVMFTGVMPRASMPTMSLPLA